MNNDVQMPPGPESLFEPKEFIISHKMAYGIALRMSAPFFFIVGAVVAGVIGAIVHKAGGWPGFRVFMPMLFFVVVCIAFVFIWTWQRVKAYPLYGIPIMHQVCPDGLRSESRVGKAYYFWERYTGCKEYSGYFLLTDGVMRYIWPKDIYTPEELAALRELFAKSLTKRR